MDEILKYTGIKNLTHSIGRGSAMAIEEDNLGNLWIGTSVTLSFYNKNLNNFINIDFTPYGVIRSLCSDNQGNMWVGTYSDYTILRQKQSVFVRIEKTKKTLMLWHQMLFCPFLKIQK
jgi:ligand-binding sensor domain-containing protein